MTETMTSSIQNSDTIDTDDILDSLIYTFGQPHDELQIPQQNNLQLVHQTAAIIPTTLNNEHDDDGGHTLLKIQITELETKLANLQKTHDEFLEKHTEMNTAYLENQNAELRYNLAQKVQNITELTTEIEALENRPSVINHSNDNEAQLKAQLKALQDQNSLLLAENVSYEVQSSEANEQMCYQDQEIERLKLELTHQRDVNDELNDQISVLQVQLANWQIDFEKEREDRIALAGDRETILTQLKYAQCRDGRLLEADRHTKRNDNCTVM